ncbi:uncharacterized protein MONOS_4939 [Monocercomonoides exilis]|uniref:uncharacterized protein n=1 Tax=Monocercomonoides exilis TaxID=2049356 RepID=UPI00355AA4BE|nr:hypothetical protein MONOS_4939 [Monocercomonoides exilis]|eukprot:MONOS_4939.1-p1 / transcript=MONOS_4939.1 / gene=MONOS_4939 / organism=Monocercomonoides_exilis_PA203 / gene_product=unspecified product / transcript_product=unspecified product / location=Mono_scaffold00138:68007-68817(+) / protein_length=223 / sequence_SO=supercontig / SO=protein_coding / is_pseudo=false
MFLSSPSAVSAESVHGMTKSDVINSSPSVSSSSAAASVSSSSSSSSSQSSHPSQHPHIQQSTFQPSSLKPLDLQSSRAPAASLHLRLQSDEVEVLRGVTSLLWSIKATLSSLFLLGEDNNSNRNFNRRSRNDGSYRSDEITDYPLFADEDGNSARLDCLLLSSASSKHLAILTKASTGRLFVSPGKAEGQTHSHSQSQTLIKTQNRAQSTIFSLKKRAESFT